MARTALLSVDDVWSELESVAGYVKHERHINLSGRAIKFLLEYRDDRKRLTDELAQKTKELECIKLIAQHVSANTEDSLRELVTSHPVSGSTLTNQLFRSTVLLKAMKMSLDHCTCLTKANTKIVIHRDNNSTPIFYNVIKENYKKKDPSFDKDLERLTKLSIWINQQVEKPPAKRKSVVAEKTITLPKPTTSNHKSTPRDPGAGAPTPAPTAPQKPAGNAISYQCNLLIGTHPATKHLTTTAKFKKLPTLEEKLRFILDDFEATHSNTHQAMTVTQLKPTNLQNTPVSKTETVSRSQQTEPLPSLTSSHNREMKSAKDISTSSLKEASEDDTFSVTSSELEALLAIREQYRRILESSYGSRTFLSGKFDIGRTLDLSTPELPNSIREDHNDSLQTSHNYSLTSTELEELLMMEKNCRRILDDSQIHTTSITDHYHDMQSLTPNGLQYLLSVRDQFKRSTNSESQSTRSFRSLKSFRALSSRNNAAAVVASKADNSTQTDFFSLPKRQSASSLDSSISEIEVDRVTLSPAREAMVMWKISKQLQRGQWKVLFSRLMQRVEDRDEEEIKDDIVTIENKNTEEHHQAIASMELWQQTNGRFQIDILLDALRDIRRKDIVNDLLDYFSTQNQL